MLFALDVAFYQMTELDQGRRNVYVMGGGGRRKIFNGGSRSMEIDISFSFTKILCMKMHCHIFFWGGAERYSGPVSYNFFFEGMGGPFCFPAPLN